MREIASILIMLIGAGALIAVLDWLSRNIDDALGEMGAARKSGGRRAASDSTQHAQGHVRTHDGSATRP
jgi:NAD(P)H-dependent FMN reductase